MVDSQREVAQGGRRPGHAAASDLNAIAMTLEALAAVREDPQQFDELLQLMRENVESLKEAFAELMSGGPDCSQTAG